jgi:hypothetical protein
MEFMADNAVEILRWLHILAMVYWLGGEWGVFQTAYKVTDPKLPFEERMRHMDTAFRIDILARTGIISLLPLGLHMGYIYGLVSVGTIWLWVMWALYFALFAVTYGAYFKRGTPLGARLRTIEDWSRYLLIPTLILVGASSLLGHGPFEAGEGQRWYSAKIMTFGMLLIIGVILRYVMHEWPKLFQILAAGPNEDAEAKLAKSIRLARTVAYIYWVGIATVAFFGSVKPF